MCFWKIVLCERESFWVACLITIRAIPAISNVNITAAFYSEANILFLASSVFTFVYTYMLLQPESGILPLALTGGAYGKGAGPIYLKGLQCRGNEDNLFQCQSSNYSSDYTCTHRDDSAVICPREKHTTCSTHWVVLSTTI